MTYKVKIDYWKKFLFDDAEKAIEFAKTAKLYAEDDIPVSIELEQETAEEVMA